MEVASSGSDTLDSGKAWVMRGYMGRGGVGGGIEDCLTWVFFPLFYSPEELVQGSATLWLYLLLGRRMCLWRSLFRHLGLELFPGC